MPQRTSTGLPILLLVYLGALGVAVITGRIASTWIDHPLALVAVADLAATLFVFGCSVAANNASMYDPYWSVAPIAIALYLWGEHGGVGVLARQLVVYTLVAAWGLRLTSNFVSTWPGIAHEDWRYRDLRAQHGRRYWVVSFFGVHLMPTALVLLGCLALWPALTGTRPLGAMDIAAAMVTAGAIGIEAVADLQLHRFTARNDDPERVLEDGLWGWSRHPNYFGELSFWWGLWLFGLSGDPDAWAWTLPGPVAMTALFWFVSIPLIERRMLAKRPGYRDTRRRISRLIPLPPRG